MSINKWADSYLGPVGSVHHGCASQGAIDSPGVQEKAQGPLDINVETAVVYYRAMPSRTIKIHKKKKKKKKKKWAFIFVNVL